MKKFIIMIIFVVLLASFSACSPLTEYQLEKSQLIANDLQLGVQNLGESAKGNMLYIANNYKDRTAGNGGDKIIADWISSNLLNYDYTSATQSNDGLQEFDFDSTNQNGDKKTITTYNVFFKKPASTQSQGKIFITTYYDNCYSVENASGLMKSDGSYESGASIAVALVLAEKLSQLDLQYDLIFAFFGGGSYGYKGAENYYQNLSMQEKNEISLMINLGYLGGGDYLYGYSRDKDIDYNNLFYAIARTNELNLTSIPTDKRIATGKLYDESPYPYFHAGMMGNHMKFMGNGVPTIHFMASNWSSHENPNMTEIEGKENVLQTNSDDMTNLLSRVSQEKLSEQLGTTSQLIIMMLAEEMYQQDFSNSLINAREQEVDFGIMTGTLANVIGIIVTIISVGILIAVSMACKSNIDKNKENYKMSKTIQLAREQMQKVKNGGPLNKSDIKDIFGENFASNHDKTSDDKHDKDTKEDNTGDIFEGF